MKVLLFGGSGQVGTEIQALLRCREDDFIVAGRKGGDAGEHEIADFTTPDALQALIQRLEPDVVINAAAYTAVDRAESEPEVADCINHRAPAAIARACRQVGARLVHYSTDYVFDGTGSEPYAVNEPVSPIGVYGATKAAGEAAILESGVDALVLRTAWVYALHGHNFLRTMLRLGAERDTLRVVGDQIGSPTPAWLIARTTMELLDGRAAASTYHVVTRGSASWHAFAEAIFREAVDNGLMARVPRVESIATHEYPTPARRPAWSVLDVRETEATLGHPMPDWRDALASTFAQASRAAAPA